MSTATQLKKVSNAITGLNTAITNTFVNSAGLIAAACNAAFGGSLDISDADITVIQDNCEDNATWKGKNSAGARRSEIKSIVLAYTGLSTAAKVFKSEFGELKREHFVKVARMIPEYETPTDAALDAALYFETRADKSGNPKTQDEKLVAGLKQALANTKGTKMNAALKAFCKTYKIAV